MPEVLLADAFEWVRYAWGPAIRCRALAAVADHCFTTRAPELGPGPLSAGDGWHQVALAMGVPPHSIVRLRQVHGTGVVTLSRRQVFPPGDPDWNVADIAVSDDPSVALCVKVADCVPILLADARTGAVAAVHAGWRGTAAGAVRLAVEALGVQLGSAPEDVVAAIGPSIGPCCYRVGQDVRAAFEAAGTVEGHARRLVQPEAGLETHPRRSRHRPTASGNGPASSSTRGPPTPINCAMPACPPVRSTSRAPAPPATATSSTRTGWMARGPGGWLGLLRRDHHNFAHLVARRLSRIGKFYVFLREDRTELLTPGIDV